MIKYAQVSILTLYFGCCYGFYLLFYLTQKIFQPSHFIFLQEEIILLPRSPSPKAVFHRRQTMTKDIKRLRSEGFTVTHWKMQQDRNKAPSRGNWGEPGDGPGNKRECCNSSSNTFKETRHWGNPQCKEDKGRRLRASMSMRAESLPGVCQGHQVQRQELKAVEM